MNFLRRRVSRSPLIGEYWERGGGASYFLIKSVYQNGKFFYPFESSHSRVSLSIRSLSLVSTSIPDEGKFVRGVRCKLSLSLFLSLCLLELSTVINRSVLQYGYWKENLSRRIVAAKRGWSR